MAEVYPKRHSMTWAIIALIAAVALVIIIALAR